MTPLTYKVRYLGGPFNEQVQDYPGVPGQTITRAVEDGKVAHYGFLRRVNGVEVYGIDKVVSPKPVPRVQTLQVKLELVPGCPSPIDGTLRLRQYAERSFGYVDRVTVKEVDNEKIDPGDERFVVTVTRAPGRQTYNEEERIAKAVKREFINVERVAVRAV